MYTELELWCTIVILIVVYWQHSVSMTTNNILYPRELFWYFVHLPITDIQPALNNNGDWRDIFMLVVGNKL